MIWEHLFSKYKFIGPHRSFFFYPNWSFSIFFSSTQFSDWCKHTELNFPLPKHFHFYFVRTARVFLAVKFDTFFDGKKIIQEKIFYKSFSKDKHFQDVTDSCMSKFIRFMGLFWGLDVLLMQYPRILGKTLFKNWKSLHKFSHTKNSKCLI